MTEPQEDKALTAERRRRLKGRNWAVFGALMGFVILVFAITIIKIKVNAP